MTGLLLGLLLAQNVVAGGSISKTSVQTATTAALTFYVDPAGNNSNTCTASGAAGACATLAGAWSRLPKILRHNVTINVAAGAYATNWALDDVQINNGITLTIAGTMSSVVPATGTASGTTTASAAGSNAGPATITDSGQSWTTNNLVGKFINFTSGALSGQAFPITANTATTISLPTTITPGTGVTYTLIEPGSTFISSTASTIATLTGQGTLAFSNLYLERTGGSTLTVTNNGVSTTFTNVNIKSAGTGLSLLSGRVQLNRSTTETTGTAFNAVSMSIGTTQPYDGVLAVQNSYVKATTGAGVNFQGWRGSVSSSVIDVTTGTGVINLGVAGMQAAGLWVTCSSTGTGITIGQAPLPSSSPRYASMSSNGSQRITGCATGVLVYGFSSYIVASPAFDTVTTALSAVRGGAIDLNSTTLTFTSVTNETSLDGVAYSIAALDALAAPKGVTNIYGSRIIR